MQTDPDIRERRARALLGWIGGSIFFMLGWFFFTWLVEDETALRALRSTIVVGVLWTILMYVMMVMLPFRTKR